MTRARGSSYWLLTVLLLIAAFGGLTVASLYTYFHAKGQVPAAAPPAQCAAIEEAPPEVYIWVDPRTRCQYIATKYGITPRLTPFGHIVCSAFLDDVADTGPAVAVPQ